jgi:hypothetical protein
MRLFSQMVLMPLTAFAYGLEALTKTVRQVQRITGESLDAILAGIGRTVGRAPAGPGAAFPVGTGRVGRPLTTYPFAEEEKRTVWYSDTCGDRRAAGSADGCDNDLKLVRYWVYFDKRDYEDILQGPRTEMVLGEETAEEFRGRKKGEFLRTLADAKRPKKWVDKKYPPGVSAEHIERLPPDDEEYVRVHVEVVLERPRREADYDRRKVEVLEGISSKLG